MSKPVVKAGLFFQIFIASILKAVNKKKKSSLVQVKLKVKLKWTVDLVLGVKICKPRPTSAQKEAKLGKSVLVHWQVSSSDQTL